MLKKISGIAIIGTLVSATAFAASFTPGTYEGTGKGFGGNITVKITVDENTITKAEIYGVNETVGIGSVAIEKCPEQLIGHSDANIDGVSGATFTSNGIKTAVSQALKKAVFVPAPALTPKSSAEEAAELLEEKLVELEKIEYNEVLEFVGEVEQDGEKAWEFSAQFNFEETGRYVITESGKIYELDGRKYRLLK